MSALSEDKLRRLIEVGRGIVAELDLDTVLERVLDVARELTGARYAALGVLDERREQLDRFITRGIDDEARRAIGSLPRGHGVLGTLIRRPEPLRLADVGSHPDSWGFPQAHPPMTTFLGVPIMIGAEAYGNLYLTEKAGGAQFDAADEEAMLVLADWAAVAVRNAQAHREVSGRRDDLERAVRGLEATTEIARAVGGETDLDRILELIVKRGRAMVRARVMALLVQEGEEIVVAAAAGHAGAALVGTRIPLAESISGEVMTSRRPLRVPDLESRLRAGLAAMLEARSGLFVPMLFQGRAVGVLNAFDREAGEGEFNADDEQIMESFASSAAVAVVTAQHAASDALRRSMQATEQERSRWARELHDETLQELAALSISLSSASEFGDVDDMRTAVDDARKRAAAAARGLRGLITDLRPATLDQLGLQPALEGLVERAAEMSGLSVDLHVDLAYEAGREESRLSSDTEGSAYRLVQEALTNVVKHSGVDRAVATILEQDGRVTVTVRDEGSGFKLREETPGFGLVGMRERVALVGGSVEVRSAPGEGTTIRASLPATRANQPVVPAVSPRAQAT